MMRDLDGNVDPLQLRLSTLLRCLKMTEDLFITRTAVPASAGPRQPDTEEILVLEEEFEALDPRLWQHEVTMAGGGNGEFQVYVNNRSNSWTEDGVLYIQPTLTADWIGEKKVSGEEVFELDLWGNACTSDMSYGCCRRSDLAARRIINPIMSAQITTARSFSFTYGRVECRAKISKGDWLYPAFWMKPASQRYGDWPGASSGICSLQWRRLCCYFIDLLRSIFNISSGEIDILEARGNPPNFTPGRPDAGGNDMYSSCAHWGPTLELNQFRRTFAWKRGPNWSLADEWHTYGFHWDADGMYTYLDNDDNRVLQVPFDAPAWERGNLSRFESVNNPWRRRGNAAPFDEPFFLVLNVAVGGVGKNFVDGHGKKPWTENDTDAMAKFWEAREDWLPTWNGRDTAFKVDSVRVWQRRRDIELVSPPPELLPTKLAAG
ncbi:unnamed protein product [Phaeothamnion confervicola]